MFAICTQIKVFELIIKKKRKKHDEIVLLAKSKLSSIEFYQRLSKFITKQEGSGLLRSLGIKTPLSKTLLVGPLF